MPCIILILVLNILYFMELSYSELKKREVINVSDGRSLGKIIDLRLSFPRGVLVGITVPGRKVGFIGRLFDKSEVYIDETRIIKIGGDVILVDVSCGEERRPNEKRPPPCPPFCPPPMKMQENGTDIFSNVDGRIDTGDY